jgi:hypothetical protein
MLKSLCRKRKKNKCCKLKWLSTWARILFYHQILALSIDGYIEYCIAGIINLMFPVYSIPGEVFGRALAIICIAICFGMVPVLLIWNLKIPLERIHDQKFQEKYGFLTSNIRIHNRLQASYYHVFIARRIIFVMVVFLIKSPTF